MEDIILQNSKHQRVEISHLKTEVNETLRKFNASKQNLRHLSKPPFQHLCGKLGHTEDSRRKPRENYQTKFFGDRQNNFTATKSTRYQFTKV